MIERYPDAEALARAAAARIAASATSAVRERARFTIALSGGSTPRRTYALLAEEPLRSEIPWQHVHVFWGDERCVASDDDRSNEMMARLAFIDHLPINEQHVHAIRCAGKAAAAAADYEAVLEREFGSSDAALDLALLGMGDDGHTAALFPGSPELDEATRWTSVTRKDGEDIDRITMTLPLLNSARQVIVLVSGDSKAAMLKTIIEGHDGGENGDGNSADGRSRLPASRLSPRNGELLWMVDAAAARLTDR